MLSSIRGVVSRAARGRGCSGRVEARRRFLVPADQYDNNRTPNRFRLSYALVHYWEIVPLFVTTCAAMGIIVVAIFWATRNKVDVVFSNETGCISRTMDLRQPSVHKMLTINQRYEPWPEMQDALDKMRHAETKLRARADNCADLK